MIRPFDSLDDAFWVGEIIGFVADNTRRCRSCGDEVAFDEEGFEDYLCPRCFAEGYPDDLDDEDDEDDYDYEGW
ncbi:hypothetical protein [Candidatus Solincola tengchongensis]|uniref:hypothetical protein n=1 Tax=Candidatus Solincola tengchongensis TaxID=2900693 RepID=UPI00257B65AC|nr:hypothetical protein [Candidatus Solincola tengchongensis]